MPLEQIASVLSAPDLQSRNSLIAAHLSRMEDQLTLTQRAVASLRCLLEQAAPASITHRRVEATGAAAITETIDLADAAPWYQGALGELHATLAACRIAAQGPSGGISATELFADERGESTIYVPVTGQVRPSGRVRELEVPAVELAVIKHRGHLGEIDLAYGALASYVTERALAVEGPIREYYLVTWQDTPDESKWLTEIGWPIFRTGPQ